MTKTTALFLLPALLWTVVVPLWDQWKVALRCALAMTGVAGVVYGAWMAIIAAAGLVGDYKYYFFINTYPKPPEFGWQLVAFWWSLHGLLWVNRGLMATAGAVVLAAALGWRSAWGQDLWRNPLFGASLWTVAGSVLFMTLQDHPQPRYFAVPAFFCFFVVALGAAALLGQPGKPSKPGRPGWARGLGWAVAVAALAAAGVDGAETIGYAAHPQYSWANAAAQLAFYIDAHPNGKRLLTSISGDQITLFTHLPSLCDDFSPAGPFQQAQKVSAGLVRDMECSRSQARSTTCIPSTRSSRWPASTPWTTPTATFWCSSSCIPCPAVRCATTASRI